MSNIKSIIPALSAALGITMAFAIIRALPPTGTAGVPPAPAASPAASALPAPAGWQHYRCTFVWTAPATNVYLSVSPDGHTWQPCGIAPHPATNGVNTLYLLLPATILADSPAPRLRIGTADRRYGFDTALPKE